MKYPVFIGIDDGFIISRIYEAERSVYVAIPGVTMNLVDALLKIQERLGGWGNITIVIDPAPKVYYLGYSDHEAFKKLEKSGCSIKCEKNLRIGILMVDDQMYIFSPNSLILQSDEEVAISINAISLDKESSNSIIQAVSLSNNLHKPEIGGRVISEIETKIVKNAITNNPPKKPDLTRMLSVLTSQFQFVDITFKGSQLKNTKISLKGNELGIDDKDLVTRISGQYKVFDVLPDRYKVGMEVLKQQHKKIKEQFTKTIGQYGTMIWSSQIKDFEEAINELKSNIAIFNKSIISEISNEIENSRIRLKQFINDNYKESPQKSFSNKLAQYNKDSLIDSMIKKAFSIYSEEELMNNLELKHNYYNISSQMVADKQFIKKIEAVLHVKIEDLVKSENAFGTDNL